jgi:hypothetical protein
MKGRSTAIAVSKTDECGGQWRIDLALPNQKIAD